MAFPRLNALSYWLFLLGGIILYSSWFATGGAPKAGWTGYVPLSELPTGRATGSDLWILSLHVLTISSLAGAINFLVTIHNMRAPGMTWMRMPLFVWSMEVYACAARGRPAGALGGADAAAARPPGRHALLHPERGRQRRALPARLLVLRAPRGLHHDPARDGDRLRGASRSSRASRSSATRRSRSRRSRSASSRCSSGPTTCSRSACRAIAAFFMISSMIIAVPTGIKIFNWLATTWRGNIHFDTPMLFALGFIAVFTIGGLSGIFVAAYPFDWQVHGHLLRRRAPALRALRRLDVRDLRRRSTTGGRRCSGACSTSGWARSASG